MKEIAPCIVLIEDAFDNSEEIIEKALYDSQKSGIGKAKIYGNSVAGEVEKQVRNTNLIDISPTYKNDVFWWSTAQKIWKYADEYGNKYKIGFSNMETPQFLWYKKNEGFYQSHIDSAYSSHRIFSCVLYLNDVEEGGETFFDNFNISISPKRGSLIIFPANFAYIHGANVPVSGDKFAIVSWFN